LKSSINQNNRSFKSIKHRDTTLHYLSEMNYLQVIVLDQKERIVLNPYILDI
jgi:hypothetical protein